MYTLISEKPTWSALYGERQLKYDLPFVTTIYPSALNRVNKKETAFVVGITIETRGKSSGKKQPKQMIISTVR